MAQLLRPRDWQKIDDPARKLAESRETRIKAAMMAMFRGVKAVVGSKSVLADLERHDLNGALGVLKHADLIAAVNAAHEPIGGVFVDAARGQAQMLNDRIRVRRIAKAGEEELFGALVAYDPLENSAPLMAQRLRFQQLILGDRLEVMQRVILDALRHGIDPRGVQLALEQVIGLTPKQAEAVMNYRRLLEAGDRDALRRALRDKRFDPTVLRAIAGEADLTKAQIDAMVERYAERMLAHRAETIATTSAMQSAVDGIREAYTGAVKAGKLLDAEVRRFWQTAMDERVCPVCISIPLMNPNGVGVEEPYLSIEGPIIAPLVHPRCRCSEEYEADLTRLSESPWPFNR